MNKIIDKKRKIRKKNYPLKGMILAILPGLFGIFVIYITGFLYYYSLSEYKDYIALVICIYLISISLSCYISFFRNIILNPKKKVLYLNSDSIFIDSKGKEYKFRCNKEKDKYYYVLKTHDFIYEVLEDSNEKFNINDKKIDYWADIYTIYGKLEKVYALPILYAFAVLGILSTIKAEGSLKIFGVIFTSVFMYMIIYDYIYKYKLKNNNYCEFDETNFIRSFNIFSGIIMIGVVVFINVVFITLFFKAPDIASKIILFPFCVLGIIVFIQVIVKYIFHDYKLMKKMKKIYNIIFILFWDIAVILCTIFYISKIDYVILSLIIPFWIVGIFFTIKLLKK